MTQEWIGFMFLLGFLPFLRLFAILFNAVGLVMSVPYCHDDKQAEWLAKKIFGQRMIDKGDEKLRLQEEELATSFRAIISEMRQEE